MRFWILVGIALSKSAWWLHSPARPIQLRHGRLLQCWLLPLCFSMRLFFLFSRLFTSFLTMYILVHLMISVADKEEGVSNSIPNRSPLRSRFLPEGVDASFALQALVLRLHPSGIHLPSCSHRNHCHYPYEMKPIKSDRTTASLYRGPIITSREGGGRPVGIQDRRS